MANKNVPVDQAIPTILEGLEAIIKGIVIESSNRIIDKAPASTGKLKGSVVAGVNEVVVQFGNEDPSGSTAKAVNKDTILGSTLGDEINITVGAPYAVIIEQGSVQRPPVGFLMTTMEEMSAIIELAERDMENYR